MKVATNREMSVFARTILHNKNYAHLNAGVRESWPDVARRVAHSVVRPYLPELEGRIQKLIEDRKFLPGGRYLYACGRGFPQVNNCLAGETRFTTREGTFSLKEKVGQVVTVLNRFGEWESATVQRFGEQRLYKVTLANREVIYATRDHRWYTEEGEVVTTIDLLHVGKIPLTQHRMFPTLDEEGIRHGIVFGDGTTQKHCQTDRLVLCGKKESLAEHFSGVKELSAGPTITKLPRRYKSLPGECTSEYARGFIAGLIATDGSTKTASVTISCEGMETAERIREIAVQGGCIPTTIHVASRVSPYTGEPRELCVIGFKPFSVPLIRRDQIEDLESRKLRPTKLWVDVLSVEKTERVEEVYCVVAPRTQSFTLANGLMTGNCFLFRAQDSREGWGDLSRKVLNALMTGGGIGVVYSDIRAENTVVRGLGGYCSGPCSLMQIMNESGRFTQQGGSRRSAIWAGLSWSHPDVFKFVSMKEWSDIVKQGKKQDFNFPAPMDGTNISVILDDEFFEAYYDEAHPKSDRAHDVYWKCIGNMLRTGEPGFSVDIGENAGENLRNACTEVCSRDDSDMCNLGSINLARISSLTEFVETVELGTAFLLCGTLYSKLPLEGMYRIRERNRRLGLGLMGVHEWLLQRGSKYGPSDELGQWMDAYLMSGAFANRYSDKLGISRPIATRSIAPTGTISIVAETTSGIEPIFATALKRRYLEGKVWKAQYIVDATASRLIESGIDPDLIEDSMTLAEDVERRMSFQAWLQERVDHGISSTINLPPWGSSLNNETNVTRFGNTLLKYLPKLRGITAYPDGSRDGQPLVKAPYREAIAHLGVSFVDQSEESCKSGVCGA